MSDDPNTLPGVVPSTVLADLEDLAQHLESATLREFVQRAHAGARDRDLQLAPIAEESHRLIAARLSPKQRAVVAQFAPSENELKPISSAGLTEAERHERLLIILRNQLARVRNLRQYSGPQHRNVLTAVMQDLRTEIASLHTLLTAETTTRTASGGSPNPSLQRTPPG